MAGDGETFDVERLLEKKVERDGRILYKVRWKNFGPKDDTWVRNIAVMWPKGMRCSGSLSYLGTDFQRDILQSD